MYIGLGKFGGKGFFFQLKMTMFFTFLIENMCCGARWQCLIEPFNRSTHPQHTVKPALRSHSKDKNLFSRPIIALCWSKVLQNAPREDSAILSTSIKLPFVSKTFVLSIFEWSLKTGFTVLFMEKKKMQSGNPYYFWLWPGHPVLYLNFAKTSAWHM